MIKCVYGSLEVSTGGLVVAVMEDDDDVEYFRKEVGHMPDKGLFLQSLAMFTALYWLSLSSLCNVVVLCFWKACFANFFTV